MGRAYWEMIADEISRAGWSWGMCEAMRNWCKLQIVQIGKLGSVC